MDGASHGLWSYLLWRHETALLAVLAGVLPDVIALGPRVVGNVLRGRVKKDVIDTDHDPWQQTYSSIMFPLTHSMVIALSVTFAVFVAFGPQWWLLAWPLHILFDIFTHKPSKATPFLYPLSTFRLSGLHWSSKKFLSINVTALFVAYFAVYVL